MIKKQILKKLGVSSATLLLLLLIYLFPTKEIKTNKEITYIDENDLKEVYLLDNNNYLSQINIEIKEKEIDKSIKEKISSLINQNNLPKGFTSLFPKNTKINGLTVNDELCTIDFSKELLNVKEKDEEKLIEEIVYTITSEKEIKKVIIKVDGEDLTRLPHSRKLLPKILDRTYGINKDYDISDINNLTKTTIYFLAGEEEKYYVPVTKVTNNNEEKIVLIINELKSSPLYQSNLNSYLNNKAILKKYEIETESINLTFNDKIFDSIYDQSILEEVVYTIGKSIKENYDVKEVVFYVDDREITKF